MPHFTKRNLKSISNNFFKFSKVGEILWVSEFFTDLVVVRGYCLPIVCPLVFSFLWKAKNVTSLLFPSSKFFYWFVLYDNFSLEGGILACWILLLFWDFKFSIYFSVRNLWLCIEKKIVLIHMYIKCV